MISLISEQNAVLFGLSIQQIMSFVVISLGILLIPKIAMYGMYPYMAILYIY